MMLQMKNLHAHYANSHVLQGIDIEVAEGEIICILGRNGAGKTTSLRAMMGLIEISDGKILFDGASIVGASPHSLARRGLAYVPETRNLFPSLRVDENLEIAAGLRPGIWSIEEIYNLFPVLSERRAVQSTALSGGEQQMLAIARALVTNPRLILLDEPSEGLAPQIIAKLLTRLQNLHEHTMTMILGEQNFYFATSLASRAYVLSKGRVVWHGSSKKIIADQNIQERWLGVCSQYNRLA